MRAKRDSSRCNHESPVKTGVGTLLEFARQKKGRGGGGEGQAQRLTFEDDLDGAGMRKCQKKPNKYLKETLYIAKRDLLTLEAAEQVCVSVKRDLIHI